MDCLPKNSLEMDTFAKVVTRNASPMYLESVMLVLVVRCCCCAKGDACLLQRCLWTYIWDIWSHAHHKVYQSIACSLCFKWVVYCIVPSIIFWHLYEPVLFPIKRRIPRHLCLAVHGSRIPKTTSIRMDGQVHKVFIKQSPPGISAETYHLENPLIKQEITLYTQAELSSQF